LSTLSSGRRDLIGARLRYSQAFAGQRRYGPTCRRRFKVQEKRRLPDVLENVQLLAVSIDQAAASGSATSIRPT
jgi:hypothetical protein